MSEPLVLSVAGALDVTGFERFRGQVRSACRSDVPTVVIDLTRLTDFPTALFGLLVDANADRRVRGRRLRLVGLGTAVSAALEAPPRRA